MTIAHTITTWPSAFVLALTSSERWAAARELDADGMAASWFILIAGFALAVLTVSFLVVTFKQRSQRPKPAGNHFAKHSGKPDRDDPEGQNMPDLTCD